MILLNFSHPLTNQQKEELEQLTQQKVERDIVIPVQLDNAYDYADQMKAIVEQIPLEAETWQTEAVLINPPAYNYAALTLFAELHGRMGYFPSIIRIRPVTERTPAGFEVAEIINLQDVRDTARKTRYIEP